jgi:hypothetical protein
MRICQKCGYEKDTGFCVDCQCETMLKDEYECSCGKVVSKLYNGMCSDCYDECEASIEATIEKSERDLNEYLDSLE